jgi:hypothetical protein
MRDNDFFAYRLVETLAEACIEQREGACEN